MPTATISALTVYPLKSCRGIGTARAALTRSGLALEGARDREWMIVDRNGRFVTQREEPRLARIETALGPGGLEANIPGLGSVALAADGTARDVVVWQAHVRGFDAGEATADAFSAYLGRDVRVVRFDDSKPRRCNPQYAGSSGATALFADGYPLLVIGQATLDDLNARLDSNGSPSLPMDRFRPNVVVEGLDAGDEDHVDTITFGDVALKLVKPCTRCEITTTDQQTARRGIEPLRTLSTYRRDDRLAGVTFGMNAIVAAGEGRALAVGDIGEVALRF
jgi:uncharacterized protein YcbX